MSADAQTPARRVRTKRKPRPGLKRTPKPKPSKAHLDARARAIERDTKRRVDEARAEAEGAEVALPSPVTTRRPDMLGNRLWMRRRTEGRIFETPEQMWEAVEKYFEWFADNPLQEARVVTPGGIPMVIPVDKMRAMSKKSLCLHLGIATTTWDNYADREEFKELHAAITDAIWVQKFEGSGAGLLNPAIIARELGLAEHVDHSSGGKSITEITRTIIDDAKERS